MNNTIYVESPSFWINLDNPFEIIYELKSFTNINGKYKHIHIQVSSNLNYPIPNSNQILYIYSKHSTLLGRYYLLKTLTKSKLNTLLNL